MTLFELYQHWHEQLKTAIFPDKSETIVPLTVNKVLLNRVLNIKHDAKLKANG